jgi:hypothetical protein
VYTLVVTSRKRPYNVKIDPELIEALRAIKTRDGISESEQIRRGIRLWLKAKGVRIAADLKHAVVRKRP